MLASREPEYATRSCGSSSSAPARSGRPIVEALHDDHEITVLDTRGVAAPGAHRSLRRRGLRGRRHEPEGPRSGRDRRRRPRDRLHVARRGQPRRRHVRPPRGGGRDDRHPHVEHRVRRALARGAAGRRLRRLVRARDGARDQPHRRRPGRATDGRLRRRPGADRRVRRRRGRVAAGARRAAAGRRDPRRLEGRGDHPRRRDDPSRRRRRDPRRRPDRRHRLARAPSRTGARCSGPRAARCGTS